MEVAFAVLPKGSPSVNMVGSTFVLFVLLSQESFRRFRDIELSIVKNEQVVSSERYPAQSSASASCEKSGTSASNEEPAYPMPTRAPRGMADVVNDSCATAGPASHQPAGTAAAASGHQATGPLAASGSQPATLAATAATKSEAPKELNGDWGMWLRLHQEDEEKAKTSKASDVFFVDTASGLGSSLVSL